MTGSQRIVIADDHPLFREAVLIRLRMALGDDVVIEEAADLAQAHQMLGQRSPVQLLLLDLHMPGAHGLSALVHIRAQYPDVPVVMISANDTPEIMARARTLGAYGYVPKSIPGSQLAETVRRVLAGTPAWSDSLPPSPALSPEALNATRVIEGLTPQQFRIATLLAQGLLNKQIAWELGIAENTVKVHMSIILRKFNVNNRTQVALIMRALDAQTPGAN